MAQLLKEHEVLARLGIGKTKFYRDFVLTGKFKWVYIGPHSKRGLDIEVDALIAEIARQRTPLSPPPRQLRRQKNRRAA
jgi:hypothetical protein